jgi:hypothetical protein
MKGRGQYVLSVYILVGNLEALLNDVSYPAVARCKALRTVLREHFNNATATVGGFRIPLELSITCGLKTGTPSQRTTNNKQRLNMLPASVRGYLRHGEHGVKLVGSKFVRRKDAECSLVAFHDLN